MRMQSSSINWVWQNKSDSIDELDDKFAAKTNNSEYVILIFPCSSCFSKSYPTFSAVRKDVGCFLFLIENQWNEWFTLVEWIIWTVLPIRILFVFVLFERLPWDLKERENSRLDNIPSTLKCCSLNIFDSKCVVVRNSTHRWQYFHSRILAPNWSKSSKATEGKV